MRALVDALCSDACAGRAPGSPGGQLARRHVIDALRAAGLDPFEQPIPRHGGANVLATLPGRIDRWVIVGAHYDHLGGSGRRIYRGADDNAAAVAILVEVAARLAADPPDGRGVVIAAFDAEEPPWFLGEHMGSEHFARHPTVPLDRVDQFVCMDLVGHTLGPAGLPGEVRDTLFALGGERSAGTAALVDRIARAAPGVIVRRADAEIIPPLSDHGAFWSRRIPFLFLTAGRSRVYHTPEDVPELLAWDKMAATARWLERFTRESCERDDAIGFIDRRDDASTLCSVAEFAAALAPHEERAALGLAMARSLLDACDADGRLPDGRTAEAARLVALLEDGLAWLGRDIAAPARGNRRDPSIMVDGARPGHPRLRPVNSRTCTGTPRAPRRPMRSPAPLVLASAFALAAAAAAGCEDTDRPYEPWLLDELAPAEGVWIRTPEFEVPAGTEIQDCYFFRVPDLAGGVDLMIDRISLALNTGSHHMNVFRVKTIVALDPAAGAPIDLGGVQGTVIRGADDQQCWKSSNWADWPLVSNSQQSAADQQIVDWQLPDDVAMRIAPGELLMLQIHYVNSRDQVTPFVGRGGVNFYRSTDGDTQEAGTLFATQQSIRVCRSTPKPSYSGTCALPAGAHTATAVNGHFHSRGRRFRVFGWDGVSTTRPGEDAMFYDSTDWAEPDMAIDLDVRLPDTGGVWWTCDYQWTEPPGGCEAVDARDPQHAGDCCYTFGPTVESSEHCNLFLYYYPKVAGDVTCF